MKVESPDEIAFLRKLFPQESWQKYSLHLNKLSSANPLDWEEIDFPIELAIELTNYCNLRCIMCPVPLMKRKRGYMPREIFTKIINEVSEQHGFICLPQGFGESLLHKKWHELVGIARDLHIKPIIVLSNGTLIKGEALDQLIELVDAIVVTLDGATAKTYEHIRLNSSFEKVTENILQFLNKRGNKETPRLVLRIIKMKATEKDIDEFCSYWTKILDAKDIIQVAGFNDWVGSVPYIGLPAVPQLKTRTPCKMLWKNLTVYFDGVVTPCCYDSEGKLAIGDVAAKSLVDIWRGDNLRELRNLHLKGDFEKISLCSQCKNWL